jgi:hypothetical protein
MPVACTYVIHYILNYVALHLSVDFLGSIDCKFYFFLQIEGASCEGGKGPNIWDTFSHIQGYVQSAYNYNIANMRCNALFD